LKVFKPMGITSLIQAWKTNKILSDLVWGKFFFASEIVSGAMSEKLSNFMEPYEFTMYN